MARYREFRAGSCCKSSCETSRTSTVPVVRSYGTISSTGVLPAGQTCPSSITEVEFSLNINRTGRSYEGEVYLVDYDTREKINSKRLIYFEESSDSQIITIFIVECGNGNCAYELIVTVSCKNCTSKSNGKLFAYVPAIYNQGLNIGGNLIHGEVVIYGSECCHEWEYHSAFATNGTVMGMEREEEEECTFYDTSNSPNSCCSNRATSTNATTSTGNTNSTNTTNATRNTNNSTSSGSSNSSTNSTSNRSSTSNTNSTTAASNRNRN